MVKGTLWLKNPEIETDADGCRIYVSGSVFIQGGIRYVSAGGTPNLQISSARAILLGFDATSLNERLALGPNHGLPGSDRNWVLPYFVSRASSEPGRSPQAVGEELVNDSLALPGLADADTVSSAELAEFQFTHLLLNAPQIHSRYARPFMGTLIGELVLFRLGQFQFQFDPVFQDAPALPALPRDVLKVSDN